MSFRLRTAICSLLKVGGLATVLLFTSAAHAAPGLGDGSIERPDRGPNPDRGLHVYQAYCVGCHGENGNGDGPVAGKLFRDFGVRPSDLSAAWFHDSTSNEKLKAAIAGGGKAVHRTEFMPAWGAALSDRQLDDLVAYLRELEPKAHEISAAIVPVGDELELGRVLYTLRCLACHGSQGRGDGPFLEGLTLGGSTLVKLPDFSDYDFLRPRSDQSFIDVLAMGIAHSGLLSSTEQGWWDRPLDPEELQALFFYIRSLPLQPSRIRG